MQTEYELMHYGILGMKWGVRRYQPYGEGGYNPKHKGVNKVKSSKQRRKARLKKERQARENDKRNVSMLSDKTLEQKVKRLQKEKQLKDLTDEMLHPGRTMVKKAAKGAVGTVISGAIAYGGYLILQKALGTKIQLPTPKYNGEKMELKEYLKKIHIYPGDMVLDTPQDIAKVLVKGGFKKK